MSEAPCCQNGLRALISRKLGRCPRCMRASALGTLVGWMTFATIYVVWPHPTLLALGLLVAASFTLLLLAHLIAFMARVVPLHPVLHADHMGSIPAEFSMGRRAMLMRFGQATIWAAAVFGFSLLRMPRAGEAVPMGECAGEHSTNVQLGGVHVCAGDLDGAEHAARDKFNQAALDEAKKECAMFNECIDKTIPCVPIAESVARRVPPRLLFITCTKEQSTSACKNVPNCFGACWNCLGVLQGVRCRCKATPGKK